MWFKLNQRVGMGIMETGSNTAQLIDFLQEELALSSTSIAMALRYSEQNNDPLPMILWQYGLVSIDQLAQIFDWLEDSQTRKADWVVGQRLMRLSSQRDATIPAN